MIPTPRTFHALINFENTIFLVGGNDGKKKNNDMYSISVYDNNCYDISSVADPENGIKNNFFENVESKLEFIDE